MKIKKETDITAWLPTFGFFAFLVIQICVLILGDSHNALSHGMGDPATPRHLRSGLMISQTGQIPHYNWLGFENPGLPWVDFEWGFESLIITLYQWGGAPLLTMMLYGLYGLTIVAINRTLLKTGCSLPVTILVTAVTSLCLIMHFNVRPPMITYLFLALFVEVWRMRLTVPLLRDWICLPIVCTAWVSLHGAWIAAFLFLGFSFVGRVLDMFFGQTKWDYNRVVPWLGLIILCGLATLLNPWGVHMPIHLVLMTLTYKSFALWNEYQVPNFSLPSLSGLIMLLYLVVLLGTRLLKNAPIWNLETGLPMLLFTYFAFKAQRHAMLFVVVAAVPTARDLEFILQEYFLKGMTSLKEWLDDFQERQRSAGGDAVLCVVAWLVITYFYLHLDLAKNDPDIGGEHVSQEAIDFIKAHPENFKRCLTTTSDGGPLLWLARPNFRVAFDDRGDLYGDDQVFAMIRLEETHGDWRETLAKGNYDSAVIDANLPLAHLLAYEPGWTLVYPPKEEVEKLEASTNPFMASTYAPKPPTPIAALSSPKDSNDIKNQIFIFLHNSNQKNGSG